MLLLPLYVGIVTSYKHQKEVYMYLCSPLPPPPPPLVSIHIHYIQQLMVVGFHKPSLWF